MFAFGPDGVLYATDCDNGVVVAVDSVTTAHLVVGGLTTGGAAFGDGGPATRASLYWPLTTAVDATGNVYIADDNHNRVRKVTPDGTITTVIGDGTAASTGDGGPASRARVNDPQGVILDAAGNLYVSEYGGNSRPAGGNRIRRISPAGIVTTLAGTGHDGLTGIPGPATHADIPQPGMLAIGPDGALYVQDEEYGRVLRIDLATRRVKAGTPKGVTVTVTVPS
jgi:serine/threonine-protein kinase